MTDPYQDPTRPIDERISDLLGRMTIAEKVGQLTQVGQLEDAHIPDIRAGAIGSSLGADGPMAGNQPQKRMRAGRLDAMQRIAVGESRLGIPLLFARDVIHGYRTIFPIPLGQAASWDPALVEEGCAIAAREARADGIRWTFAPMMDIARDARWGRVAEGYGEDPLLASAMAVASVRGFQGDDIAAPGRLAACAKHFVGYGAAEGGRDYNACEISGHTLRNVYLPPFAAAVRAGVATVMAAFNEIGGEPMTSHRRLLRGVLKGEYRWDGMVVSDWTAVAELIPHGQAADQADAARLAARAGIDMEMASTCYRSQLAAEVAAGRVPVAELDEAVTRVLRLKFRLGLFERPYADEPADASSCIASEHRAAARRAAGAGLVLLKHDPALLPLRRGKLRLGLFGPHALVHDGSALFGCWTLDGEAGDATSLHDAVRERLAEGGTLVAARSWDDAAYHARACDALVIVLGEAPARSGEARCVTSVDLPPGQVQQFASLVQLGLPVIAVVISGRPLAIPEVLRDARAVLWSFHPGGEGGHAIADALFGVINPGGKLPVTLPRSTGQLPLFYNHKNTGRPPAVDGDGRPTPFSTGYLDERLSPLLPFGFGLSYTTFAYRDLAIDRSEVALTGHAVVSVTVENGGALAGDEVVQLYLRDHACSRTRPVRELKGFRRIALAAGAWMRVEFVLGPDELGFIADDGTTVVEPGDFTIWVGGDSRAELAVGLRVVGT